MVALALALAYWLWPYVLLIAVAALIIGFCDARFFPKPRREEPDLVGRLRREEFARAVCARRSEAQGRLGRSDPGN